MSYSRPLWIDHMDHLNGPKTGPGNRKTKTETSRTRYLSSVRYDLTDEVPNTHVVHLSTWKKYMNKFHMFIDLWFRTNSRNWRNILRNIFCPVDEMIFYNPYTKNREKLDLRIIDTRKSGRRRDGLDNSNYGRLLKLERPTLRREGWIPELTFTYR